ncbi:hypothetical protein DVJ78_16940 [Humibacter sp. BT305]|nr:hypothetical protein DVJ78_16940 [Humibacter sp. BT305]
MRFEGLIAGVGTSSGRRVVAGLWTRSPLGRFGDVMVEDAAGHRILLAPRDEVAELVSATYRFDEVRTVPVRWRVTADAAEVDAGDLRLRMGLGPRSGLGRLLRLQPRRLARSTRWLTLLDPVARLLVRGAATAGSAGGGRREYYGVTDARSIRWLEAGDATGSWGRLAPLSPSPRFGFAATPAAPTIVRVTTTIVPPQGEESPAASAE